MTHKTIINICLSLIALCWTVAIQAQDATVDGIKYSLRKSLITAEGKDNISSSHFVQYDVTVTAQEKGAGLLKALPPDSLGLVSSLKVTGTINGYDIMLIRNKMTVLFLDLTDADIVANDYEYYTGCHTEDNVIGDYMFAGLEWLHSVKLPKNATSIRSYAVYNCVRLKDIVLPAKLESIGSSAFSQCYQLEHIKLPPMLKSLGDSAFKKCIELENIEFPSTLKSIGSSAFEGCSKLKTISLSEVETIGRSAFSGCDKLNELRIPSTLKSIDDRAFNCKNLQKVYTYTVEPVNIGQTTFSNYATGTLYVPRQAYNNYYYNVSSTKYKCLKIW